MTINGLQKTENSTCTCCGSKGEVVCTGGEVFLCGKCFSAIYARCPNCGKYVKKEEIEEYDPGYCGRDIRLCTRCAEKYGY